MAARPHLRTVNGARSGPRQQLHDAIAYRQAAVKALTGTHAAADNMRRACWRAENALTEATANIDTARTETAARVAAAALAGNEPAPDRALRDARARELECQDALETSRRALAQLETTIPECERDRQWAEGQVNKAVAAVLADESPSVEHLRSKLEAAEQQLIAIRSLWSFLLDRGAISNDPDAVRFPDHPARRDWGATETKLRKSERFDGDKESPVRIAWEQAFEALAKDADVALPSIE